MTDTASAAPSDLDIDATWDALPGIRIHNDANARGLDTQTMLRRAFARAVLAKWGQHTRIAELEAQLEAIGAGGVEPLRKISEQPAAGQEPVAWRTFDGEGGYDYRTYDDNENYREEWGRRNPNHKGWVDPLYAAPQPVAREPLTRQQLCEAFYSETACTLGGDVDFAEKVCRVVEKAHGIKGGQHGTE